MEMKKGGYTLAKYIGLDYKQGWDLRVVNEFTGEKCRRVKSDRNVSTSRNYQSGQSIK